MKKTKTELNIEHLPLSVQSYISQAVIYDSSSSPEAKTFFVENTAPFFLKISRAGSLESECVMSRFLHQHRLAPSVLHYHTEGDYDYLLTAAVEGEDGVAPEYLKHPDQLAAAFGQHLRRLHSIPADHCPYPDRSKAIMEQIPADAARSLNKQIHYTPIDNVIIHGDYCLPNVIMKQLEFCAFIDTGEGGIGDRHYDLAWGLWTLHYNLDTDRYDDIFLEAYGKEDINPDGVLYFSEVIKHIE